MALRTMIVAMFAAAAAAAPAAAAERSWRDFPAVENTSYVEPSGDRSIQLSTIVPATPRQAFAAFTTDAGMQAWAVKMAKIDLRVGGMIESSYAEGAKPGEKQPLTIPKKGAQLKGSPRATEPGFGAEPRLNGAVAR